MSNPGAVVTWLPLFRFRQGRHLPTVNLRNRTTAMTTKTERIRALNDQLRTTGQGVISL